MEHVWLPQSNGVLNTRRNCWKKKRERKKNWTWLYTVYMLSFWSLWICILFCPYLGSLLASQRFVYYQWIILAWASPGSFKIYILFCPCFGLPPSFFGIYLLMLLIISRFLRLLYWPSAKPIPLGLGNRAAENSQTTCYWHFQNVGCLLSRNSKLHKSFYKTQKSKLIWRDSRAAL